MVPMFMCGLVRSNFCFDMFAISFVSPLSLWPVDWRPPATEMRQGFLALASLAGRGAGIRAHGVVGATDGRAGCGNVSDAVDGHVFGLHQIDLNAVVHS
ncbi:MAG TPA: hypothetical protein VFS52_05650 [Steroidobacteraceae bacterium]|nr:hypothetical protein [Steroidobacteraceae bacterium]